MNTISFFTPVSYVNKNASFSERLLEKVDDYFFWGGKKAKVIPISGDRVQLVDEKVPLLKNVAKISSYFFVLFPLVAFVTKSILRSCHSFCTLDQDILQNTQGLLQGAIARRAFIRKGTRVEVMQGMLRESSECQSLKREQKAAITVQTAYRRHKAKTALLELRRKVEQQNLAASETQSMLRMHRVKAARTQTYGLYRGLGSRKDVVAGGYGEFVVFHSAARSDATPSKETFAAAYNAIQKYNHNPEVITDNRADVIRREIKKIDPSLELSFVPRTLYDLFFIRAGIEEEIKERWFCQFQYDSTDSFETFCERVRKKHTAARADEIVQSSLRNCWHICKFSDKNPFHPDDKVLQTLAWRLNNLIIEKLRPKGFFNGLEIIQASESQIDFFKNHSATFPELFQKGAIKGLCGVQGSSLNFGLPHQNFGRYHCLPMGISDNKAAQIVRNAISLECSAVAQSAFILYRAGGFICDKKLDERFMQKVSLSYGTSLFAGALYDPTATVFYYTVSKKRDTYAVVVPYKDYRASPYYVPFANAIGQACSRGEFFHPRSKISGKDEHVLGIFSITDEKRPPELIHSKNLSEFTREINEYQARLIPLSC